MMIPFVLPTTVLSTMTLSAGVSPWFNCSAIPKLLPCVAYPFPPVRFPRSRLRFEPPNSHMPPQAIVALPLRTAMLPSNSLSGECPTRIPEAQLVDAVTSATRTREVCPVR
jgi:hypothetical protein